MEVQTKKYPKTVIKGLLTVLLFVMAAVTVLGFIITAAALTGEVYTTAKAQLRGEVTGNISEWMQRHLPAVPASTVIRLVVFAVDAVYALRYAAPVITAVCCFIFLFIMQNVFSQKVFIPKTYSLSSSVLNEIKTKTGIPVSSFEMLKGEKFQAGQELVSAIEKYYPELTNAQALKILSYAEVVNMLSTSS